MPLGYEVSDPYPKTVEQPTEFEVYVDGATTPIPSVPAIDANGLKYFKLDLDTLNVSVGLHTVKVRARGAGGDSVDSVPFTFSRLGAPGPPSNLRYSKT